MYTSNGKIVGKWIPYVPGIQPSVLLAVLAGLSNASLGLVLSGGVTVVWWLSAQTGVSLAELHYISNKGEWSSIRGWWRAMSSGLAVSKVVVVTLLVSTATLAGNPPLQRATHTVRGFSVTEYDWSWNIAQRIPDGFTGSIGYTYKSLMSNFGFRQILQEWYRNEPIHNRVDHKGNAAGTLIGAGVKIDCVHTSQYFDLSATENANTTIFGIEFQRVEDIARIPNLMMKTWYPSNIDGSCKATLETANCTIQTALVLYNITIEDASIYLVSGTTPVVQSLQPSLGDSSSAKLGTGAGLLAGMSWFGNEYLHSQVDLIHNLTTNTYVSYANGVTGYQYENIGQSELNYVPCQFDYSDPTEDLKRHVHNIALRAAFAAPYGSHNPLSTY